MQMDGSIGTDKILCTPFLYFSRSCRCIEDKAVIFQSNCQNGYCIGWCQLFLSPLGNYGKSRFMGYLSGWRLKNKKIAMIYWSVVLLSQHFSLSQWTFSFNTKYGFYIFIPFLITSSNCKQKLQFTDRFMRCSISW